MSNRTSIRKDELARLRAVERAALRYFDMWAAGGDVFYVEECRGVDDSGYDCSEQWPCPMCELALAFGDTPKYGVDVEAAS